MSCSIDELTRRFYLDQPILEARLRHAFPKMCIGHIEDALAVGLQWAWQAIAAGEAQGLEELMRQLYTVAWRHVRGQWRSAFSRTSTALVGDGPVNQLTPERVLQARSELALLHRLAPAAAMRFDRGNHEQMTQALCTRLSEELSDTEAAQRHGVGRSSLNRAKRWIIAQASTS